MKDNLGSHRHAVTRDGCQSDGISRGMKYQPLLPCSVVTVMPEAMANLAGDYFRRS